MRSGDQVEKSEEITDAEDRHGRLREHINMSGISNQAEDRTYRST